MGAIENRHQVESEERDVVNKLPRHFQSSEYKSNLSELRRLLASKSQKTATEPDQQKLL